MSATIPVWPWAIYHTVLLQALFLSLLKEDSNAVYLMGVWGLTALMSRPSTVSTSPRHCLIIFLLHFFLLYLLLSLPPLLSSILQEWHLAIPRDAPWHGIHWGNQSPMTWEEGSLEVTITEELSGWMTANNSGLKLTRLALSCKVLPHHYWDQRSVNLPQERWQIFSVLQVTQSPSCDCTTPSLSESSQRQFVNGWARGVLYWWTQIWISLNFHVM